MSVGSEPLSASEMTGTVKALLVLQMLGLALMGFWLAKEYENNIYLREYVHNTAWTYLPVLAFIATFTVALGISEAYARVHSSKSVEPLSAAGQEPGPLLTGGFGAGSPASQQDTSVGSVVEGSGEGSGQMPGASFAEIFDSRPPAVLKHVESSEAIEVYSPPPFPVIRRLKPARDPVEEEAPRPSPRPLNRVGAPFANVLLPPPTVRQFERRTVADDGEGEDSAVEAIGQDEASPGSEEAGSRKESTRPAKPRAARKKPEITGDLSNDLTGG